MARTVGTDHGLFVRGRDQARRTGMMAIPSGLRRGPRDAVTRVNVLGVSVEPIRPSAVDPSTWAAIVGPWEIDCSYAGMRAIEEHPFNDSTDGQTFWWQVRRDDDVLGYCSGYVTETYNFAPLFAVGVVRTISIEADRVYCWLNRHALFGPLDRIGIGRVLRLLSGRPRVMFLGSHTGDVGGQVSGEPAQRVPPEVYLPALTTMIDRESRALHVEQVTLRDITEHDEGPFRFANLWHARWPDGRPVLETLGFRRDPGLPCGYIDLRAAAAARPNDGDVVYAFYRHGSEAEFLAYETARHAWLVEAARMLGSDPGVQLPFEMIARHPRTSDRSGDTRLAGIRTQLFRSGLVPPALGRLAELDRAEGALRKAQTTAARLESLRRLADDLRGRIADEEARLPHDTTPDTYRRAERIARCPDGPVGDAAAERSRHRQDLVALAEACQREQAIHSQMDPAFASLPSDVRRKLVELAGGRIRQPDVEARRLVPSLSGGTSDPDGATGHERVAAYLVLARHDADLDQGLRAVRTEIQTLSRRAHVRAADAEGLPAAVGLLADHGWQLPEEATPVLDRIESLDRQLARVCAVIDAAERDLSATAALVQPLLVGGDGSQAQAELARAARTVFRREQDRIVTTRFGGTPPGSPAERRARLESVLSYRPIDYGRLLLGIETVRDVDRGRMVREHEAHRARVRDQWPDQPGPTAPAFDDEGYLADGLTFTGRDERVWTNLADQDRITDLYHRVVAKSLLRHDVVDWPYYAAYRAAGVESGDELHFATLRAGGATGPIVAAVSVKRSPAGHFRPERLAMGGIDFGAYHSITVLHMAHEVSLGGTFCTLGQTSQGAKLRDFGAAFTEAKEYTRFQGLATKLFGFDRRWQAAFKEIHLDRILEIAALPPEQRAEARRRAGIRWHI